MAAEKKIIVNHIPATGPRYKQERYISGYETRVNAPEFDDNLVGTDIEFAWTHDSINYTYLNTTNLVHNLTAYSSMKVILYYSRMENMPY